MNVALLLETVAADRPAAIAVQDDDGRDSYAELLDGARGLAAWLERAAPPGPVAFVGTNRREMVELLFAAAYAGRTFFPLNFRIKQEEMARQLARVAPTLAMVGERNRDMVTAAARAGAVDCRILTAEALVAEAAAADGDAVTAPFDAAAAALYLATSGTTSDPKFAVVTHGNLFEYVVNTVEAASADAGEAVLVSAPTYHIAGIAQLLGNVFRGRRIVLMSQFDALRWLELVRDEEITHAMVVPTMLRRILDLLDTRPDLAPRTLVSLSYGGAKAPPGLVERALRTLPGQVGLSNAFGLTETTSTVAVLSPEDHRRAIASDDPAVRARLDSVGHPIPGVEVMIMRADGSAAEPDEQGEVCIRGGHVSPGYLGKRAALDDAGWLHTADQGRLDADGYLFLGRRDDDVIIRGGENVDPTEIEAVVLSHPAVSDVAVVGVPDAEWGEAIGALVVGDSETSTDDLQRWVRERLAGYRVPALVHWTEELPRNEMGKLVRRWARQEILVGLDHAEEEDV